MAGGDSLVAHPRVCRPRCEVVCRKPGRRSQCNAPHQRRREQRKSRMEPVHDRPPTGSIPDAPGSYQFYDAEGRVLYVGKAKSLRHRLPNYWQKSAQLGPRTAQMVAQADHVEWVVVDSEVDALDPGALADPGAPAPLQRPAEGRQELSRGSPSR